MLLDRDRSFLVVIDVQAKLMPEIAGGAALLPRLDVLVRAASRLGVPTLLTEQNPKGLGPTLEPLRGRVVPEAILPKMTFSIWRDGPTREHIRRIAVGRNQAVLAGVEAHVCVNQSAQDMLAAGYEVFIVTDATGSRRAEAAALAYQRLAKEGATMVNIDMTLFEWLKAADDPAFKPVLPLIKELG